MTRQATQIFDELKSLICGNSEQIAKLTDVDLKKSALDVVIASVEAQ